MSTYRAIQVAPDGSLELTVRDRINPPAGHVRIRVEVCGICHSDSASVHEHSAIEPGRVPGHEAVGRIDAVGEGVKNWSLGARVGVGFLGGACGACDECRRGRFVSCNDQPNTGYTVDGGYAEEMIVRASGLVAIPDTLTSLEAAPLLCAGFTSYNALLKARPTPYSLVAIQGIGGLGHLALQYAQRFGAEVVAIARGTTKSELSSKLGAHHYIDSTVGDLGLELQKLGGADVILATGVSGASMTSLIPGLRNGGTLMVVGVSPEPINVTPMDLIFGGVTLVGSLTGTSIENEENLKFAAAHDVRALVEEVPFEAAQAAFDRMMSGDARFRMVLNIGVGARAA